MASNALYISIYQELLHDIQSGKYIENEPLPSEESLCRSYNVSRTTVHKALDMLKDADVVYSVQGNGAYVKPHMFAQPLSKFYSFTDSLKRRRARVTRWGRCFTSLSACVRRRSIR